MASHRLIALFAVVSALAWDCVSAQAYPPLDTPYPAPAQPAYPSPPAAEYKPNYANGRVKIQAYRGPSKEYGGDKGYKKESFAPWGFYVTQPEDNKPNYG